MALSGTYYFEGAQNAAFAAYLCQYESEQLCLARQHDEDIDQELNLMRLEEARRAKADALASLNRQEPGEAYRPHWLESTAMAASGALIFMMELMERELHGFAQYHMLPCVCQSFKQQLSVIATEWSKRRQDYKPGPVSQRKPFVSKWFHPLPVAERATGKAICTDRNDSVDTEYPYSVHPQQNLIRIGSVVTHLELNLEHMTQRGISPPSHDQPCFLSNEFVEMMNELPDHLADDLCKWASQRNVTKKLLVYHVHQTADCDPEDLTFGQGFELHKSLIFFCPLVSLETMMHPRFQMMFPTSALAVERILVANGWALTDFSDMKQELCTWFTERNLVSIVQFCREIGHEIILNSDYRHYLLPRCAQQQETHEPNNPKKYSSRFWLTDNRKFLWDCTACPDVFTHPSFMRATDTCMFAETEERVRAIVFEDKTPPTEWVPGASLLGDSVHFLPEIILDLQTDLYALMGLTGDRTLDRTQLTNEDIPDVDICLEFGAMFPVCTTCEQAAEQYKSNAQDRPRSSCCLRRMTYANYSWDESFSFKRYDDEQDTQEQYSNSVANYRPCHSFLVDENGLWVVEDPL